MRYLLIHILFVLFFSTYVNANKKIENTKISEALTFCKKKNMDTNICIMIDMSIPSGKNRIFVWDFNKKSILFEGLCAHGVGGGSTLQRLIIVMQ